MLKFECQHQAANFIPCPHGCNDPPPYEDLAELADHILECARRGLAPFEIARHLYAHGYRKNR